MTDEYEEGTYYSIDYENNGKWKLSISWVNTR